MSDFFWTDEEEGSTEDTPTPAKNPVPDEDPLKGLKSNMKWQTAWMAAIALAWANCDDKAALLSNASEFLRTRCGWKVPRGLHLEVTEEPRKDDGGHRTGWYPEGIPGEEKKPGRGWHLAKTKVIMYLPPSPDVEHHSVALANYLATGRTYPFTSC